jgi:predicted MFS family arabinose efflux permease
MRDATGLSLAGFMATAVAFGPARMGYGLFLPSFRETFGLSTQTAGFIASAAFGAFLVALLLTAGALHRLGPRAPVVAGGAAAAVGAGIVAAAEGIAMLTAGVVLAAASAGFSWTPYNTAVQRVIPGPLQGRVLAVVSTGTTVGIAAAAMLALAVDLKGLPWRASWAAFAAAGAIAAGLNAREMRRAERAPPQGRGPDLVRAARRLAGRATTRRGVPLVLAAGSFGATSAIYLAFAADLISGAGGLPGLAPELSGAAVFASYGAGGFVGLLTGDAEKRAGIGPLLRGVFLASAASLALAAAAPESWAATTAAAATQGACLMVISAIFSLWTLRLNPDLPAMGFCAVLVAFAAGNIAATAAAGVAAELWSLAAVFWGSAAVSLLTAGALASRRVDVW